jgi:hypothetical protein
MIDGRPDPGTAKQIFHRSDKLRERSFHSRDANNKDKIPASGKPRIHQPYRFAYPSLGTIAVMGFADLFPDDKTTACAARPIPRDVQDQQAMRPAFPLTSHSCELIGLP